MALVPPEPHQSMPGRGAEMLEDQHPRQMQSRPTLRLSGFVKNLVWRLSGSIAAAPRGEAEPKGEQAYRCGFRDHGAENIQFAENVVAIIKRLEANRGYP